MKKKLITLSMSVLASATLISPVLSIGAEDPIATVGDVAISQEDFYIALKNLAGTAALRTMILEEILKQNVEDAEKLQKQAAEEVKQQIEEAGGRESFEQLLAMQQMGTVEEFEYQVFVRNMFQEVVEKHIDLTDEAIQKFYEEGYQVPMEAQHILVETEEEAQEILGKLEAGEEFDALAQEFSLDSTAANGGLLGEFLPGQMVPEFEEAVVNGENDQVVSNPVESEFGFHIIKVLNNGTKLPFEEVREKVEEQYKISKFSDSTFAYSIVGQLIKEANVTINDEDLKDAVKDLVDLADMDQLEAPESNEESIEESSEE